MHSTVEFGDEVSSRAKGSAVRRAVTAVAVLFVASVLALIASPAQSADGSLPKITGAVPRFGVDAARALGVADLRAITDPAEHGNGVALIDPGLDRIFQLYNLAADPHPHALAIVERDLETFSVKRTKIIPDRHAYMANGSKGAEWVATLDNKNGRLIVAYRPSGGLEGRIRTAAMPGFLTIDLRSYEHVDSSFPNVLADFADTLLPVAGLEYDESTDTVLMLQPAAHGVGSMGNALMLSGWKASDLLKGGELPAVTPRPIRACRRDPLNDSNSHYLSPILIAAGPDKEGNGSMKTWVTVPCYSSTFSTNVVIVRMDRASALDPHATQEKAVVAPAGVTAWAFDTKHGRLYLVNESAETDAWVYEVSTNAFVGIIALSPKGIAESTALSLGVDETSGRLYGRAYSYGLMISAAAQDPVPQADVYPRLSAGGSFRILVDAKRNRILSLPGVADGNSKPGDAYEVIAVPPPLPPPVREDPDSRTAQVDEVPGKTVTQFSGNASAYGLRVLLSRGVSGAVPTNGNDNAGKVAANVNSYCGFTDRELVMARVSKTELSNNSRFARAAAVDLDNATVVDLRQPSRCDAYNSYKDIPLPVVQDYIEHVVTTGALGDVDAAGVPASKTLNDTLSPKTTWDYAAADCATAKGEDEAGPNSTPLVGPTAVECGKDDEIKAYAESRAKPLEIGDVSVAKAKAWTSVKKDKDKGLVSTSSSRIEGIKIGDISIGYIEHSATSYAKGRAKSAKTVFNKPKIGFVAGPNIPSCDTCDLEQVLKNLNVALSGRAEFRKIEPEPKLAAGTPGGYEAGIIKSEKQQASDNSLTGDKSVEIPAIEMVVYNDNPHIGRARQVYQFAGVRADSHYGIQLAGAGTGGLPNIGDVVDGATGTIDPRIGDLPNGGTPLLVRMPESNENVIKRTFRQTGDYANYSLRIIFNNPREALVMATVWLLMFGPYIASRRRRALKAVTTADPEGRLS